MQAAMSPFWLWVTLALYSLGLLDSLLTVVLRKATLFRIALAAISLGFVFHFVSLTEYALAVGHFPVSNISEATSLFAFLITMGFLIVYWVYRIQSLSVFIFPIVFVMTLASALARHPGKFDLPVFSARWLPWHISFALVGYVALFLTFVGGLMYLIQERELKRRKPHAFYYRLPPLEVVDKISYWALTIGFPFITIAIILGTLGAATTWGPGWIEDPKVWLTFLMWFVYVGLVYSRVSAGLRGRKAAYFSIVGLAAVLASWSANYLSTHHSFLGH